MFRPSANDSVVVKTTYLKTKSRPRQDQNFDGGQDLAKSKTKPRQDHFQIYYCIQC